MKIINYISKFIFKKDYSSYKWGLWGLGIGDWGFGIGPNPQSPIPNPQSPIPNPHRIELNKMKKIFLLINYFHKIKIIKQCQIFYSNFI